MRDRYEIHHAPILNDDYETNRVCIMNLLLHSICCFRYDALNRRKLYVHLIVVLLVFLGEARRLP